jgi:hypothetical protein
MRRGMSRLVFLSLSNSLHSDNTHIFISAGQTTTKRVELVTHAGSQARSSRRGFQSVCFGWEAIGMRLPALPSAETHATNAASWPRKTLPGG